MSSNKETITELSSKIREMVEKECKPHEKLLSERKLAKRFNTTHNRIHRAIQQLSEDGIVYTRTGTGTFVNSMECVVDLDAELHNDSFNIMRGLSQSMYRKLKVSIPVGSSLIQQHFWRLIIDAFTEEVPFVEIDVDFGLSGNKTADVQFISIHDLQADLDTFSPLNIQLLKKYGFDEAQLCPEICSLSRFNGELIGVPTLRIGAGLWINREIFHLYNIDTELLRSPADIFRIGCLIEEKSGFRIHGANYMGYSWHSANYGFEIRRIEDEIIVDWGRLERFLRDFAPFIRKHHLQMDSSTCPERFVNNGLAIYNGYLHSYPVFKHQDNKLSLIPYPLFEGGSIAESMLTGCIRKECRLPEEAHRLLGFLSSAKAQQIFADNAPNWFSVRKDILECQKLHSPFPDGSVCYDFNIQQHFAMFDNYIADTIGPLINTECGKLFLGYQDVETTLNQIRKSCVIHHES